MFLCVAQVAFNHMSCGGQSVWFAWILWWAESALSVWCLSTRRHWMPARTGQTCSSCHLKACTDLQKWTKLNSNLSSVQLLRAIAECFARLSHRLGVCPSVRPPVTLVSCIKTVQARITKSSLWAAPRILVYRDKISCPGWKGSPRRGRQRRVPPTPTKKRTLFCRYWLV